MRKTKTKTRTKPPATAEPLPTGAAPSGEEPEATKPDRTLTQDYLKQLANAGLDGLGASGPAAPDWVYKNKNGSKAAHVFPAGGAVAVEPDGDAPNEDPKKLLADIKQFAADHRDHWTGAALATKRKHHLTSMSGLKLEKQYQDSCLALDQLAAKAQGFLRHGKMGSFARTAFEFGRELEKADNRLADLHASKGSGGEKAASRRKRQEAVERMLVEFHRRTRSSPKKQWPKGDYKPAAAMVANAVGWEAAYIKKALPKKYLLALYQVARVLVAQQGGQSDYDGALPDAADAGRKSWPKLTEDNIRADLPIDVISRLAASMK